MARTSLNWSSDSEMLKGRFKSGGVIEVGLVGDELVFTEKSGALNTVP